jgi:outer membrane receptor protein involved in Fe transport
LTTYASVAKGFRPGGANQITASFCGPAPTSFGPDSVWNYEIGEKAKMLDGRLTVNSDFYYIKWSDVQQTLFLACGYQYGANAGKGRSFGPELEVSAKLSPEWTVALGGTYTHAEVNSPSAAFAAQVAGQYRTCPTVSNCTAPILNVPKSTGTITLTYTTQVSDYQFTARVSDSYVGSSTDVAYTFVELPSYNLANAVLSLGSDKWTARLFVTNLTNKVAEISANNTSFQVNLPGVVRISTNQPRTFGTELNYRV